MANSILENQARNCQEGKFPSHKLVQSLDTTKNFIFDSCSVFALEQDVLSKSDAGLAHTSSSLKLHVGVCGCHSPTFGRWLCISDSEVSSVTC